MHRTKVKVVEDALDANNTIARANRDDFDRAEVAVVNMMSAPGAGKTSLLERVLRDLEDVRVAVLEGDVQGSLDADRLASLHVPVTQLNTDAGFGGECHLDANMVRSALPEIPLDEVDLLVIENVGNLVCPAEFKIGEDARVMVSSVTEGEDKPLKYPLMFRACELVLVNKVDLLPHLDFDLDRFLHNLDKVNPGAERMLMSARTGEGVERFGEWLAAIPRARGSAGVTEALRSAPDQLLEDLLERRTAANARFFEAEAERIARLCHRMAERFARGGRLVALGHSPAARSDARHVAVEFVHPVIVGKRALPAIALTRDGGTLVGSGHAAGGARRHRDRRSRPTTMRPRRRWRTPAGRGCLTIAFAPAGAEWELEPPSGDPFVGQELIETLYHLLWELVHVFFEHRGLLEGRAAGPVHDTGASSFLYPFLAEGEHDLEAVLSDVRRSVGLKAAEVAALREQTLGDHRRRAGRGGRPPCATTFEAGGKLLALGNGGSATDAMDAVADFRAPRAGWTPRPALDLTEDSSILTAIANDIGPEAIFARQVIAYGHAGDALLALSTSGSSRNVIDALIEARSRGLTTIAMVGYDGGRIAEEGLADHVVVSRSQHIPRIQEAQATRLPRAARARGAGAVSVAAATARARVRVRVGGTVQGVGFRPYVFRLATALALDGFVLNDERGVVIELEGEGAAIERFLARLPAEPPPLAVVEDVATVPLPPAGESGFTIAGEPLRPPARCARGS